MVAWSLPQMFFEDGFWLAIVASLLVVLYGVKKRYPRPFPKSQEFLGRHRKAVATATDSLVIGAVLLCTLILWHLLRVDSGAWHSPSEPQEIRVMRISSLSVDMVVWSGVVGPLLGFLSFFQSNLTRFKRIALLILCLLPALFTTPGLLNASTENRWQTIQLGVIFSLPGWIVNGPGVLMGQPLSHLVWRIMCKLHLASGDMPG
jgi:hypothetical protein